MLRTTVCSVCPKIRWIEVDPVKWPGRFKRYRGKGACRCKEPRR